MSTTIRLSNLRGLAVALLVAGIATGPASGQTRRDPGNIGLPDVDLREAFVSNEAAQSPQSRTLVDRRNRAMAAFVAERQATQPGTRIVPSRHGIPKLLLREGKALSGASTRDPDDIARNFLRSNAAVFPFSGSEVDQLRLEVRDVTANSTHLVYHQTVNGIDVFQGQLKFTLGKGGEVIQVGSGEVVPALSAPTVPRLQPADAEAAARSAVEAKTGGQFLRAPELVIFPLDSSTARLAYHLYFELDAAHLYEILIDAETGALLFRHNGYVNAAQARVWTQSPAQGTRELQTLPAGWLPASASVTIGNNVDAFIDANGDDKPDALDTNGLQGGRPVSATQIFDFSFGDGTLAMNPRDSKAASATNLFYFVNLAHDYYLSLGFNEAAGNFQTDNFGNGGQGGDAVIAEAQSGSSPNNARFSPTPDGIPPRIRMGLFNRSTASLIDDLDSAYDGQVVMHEYGHGVSNRLVGGRTSISCLNQIQSGAMGEGWSDYFATSYFNTPVVGAYITQDPIKGFRRQSYEGYTFTYEDIGNAGYQEHRDGEIWAATLWDLRKSLGQAKTDQLVVDGLKATPCNPSMTDARDAILSADLASNGGANRIAIWTVFAKHGMGYSARGADGGIGSGTLYDAAYNLPPDLQPTTLNPMITSQPLSRHVGAGDLYGYTVTASNPNAGSLSFALTSGPADMTVDPSGVVNWNVSFTSQRVKITVTDGKGGKVVHGYLAPVFTRLTAGQSVMIGGAANSTGFAYLDVSGSAPILQVTLRGGTGDADLFIIDPDGNVASSSRDGNNETLSFANPKAGRWQIEGDGYHLYSSVSLMAALITPTALSPNAVVNGLGGVVGSETLYQVTLPAGGSSFRVTATGGTGDVDLYLKLGSPALCQISFSVDTACHFDQFSEQDGNAESITVNPVAGDWYIDLSAYDDYSDVTLTTSLSTEIPSPDLTISKSHTGNFTPGQTGAAYTVTIANAGNSATIGPVSVTDTLPSGLTASAISGSGWSCLVGTLMCARNDALAPSASYPPITVTVNVATNAPPTVTNVAIVSGGGEVNTGNNSAQDLTVIGSVATPTVTLVANAFGDIPLIAPNMWVQIKGTNLAPAGFSSPDCAPGYCWQGSDFVGNQLPTQLGGVRVTLNGNSAYVYFVSSTQINILTPPDALSGSVQVQVTNNGAASNVATVQAQAQSLSFFEFVSTEGKHYVYGRHTPNGSLIGPPGLFPVAPNATTPVKPDEDIYIAATGFGPTDVPVVSGGVTQSGNLPAPFPVITIGGVPATVSFAGLVGVGTYQINFKVPRDLPDGDLPLAATYNGLSIQPNLLITVQH